MALIWCMWRPQLLWLWSRACGGASSKGCRASMWAKQLLAMLVAVAMGQLAIGWPGLYQPSFPSCCQGPHLLDHATKFWNRTCPTTSGKLLVAQGASYNTSAGWIWPTSHMFDTPVRGIFWESLPEYTFIKRNVCHHGTLVITNMLIAVFSIESKKGYTYLEQWMFKMTHALDSSTFALNTIGEVVISFSLSQAVCLDRAKYGQWDTFDCTKQEESF